MRGSQHRTGPDDRFNTLVSGLTRVCERVARGDFEARLGTIAGEETDPALAAPRWEFNRLIDTTDAFVREAGASLTSATEGRYHRQFLERGLHGSFRTGARTINEARETMRSGDLALAAAGRRRDELADQLERTVLSVSEQVAQASANLGSSAAVLHTSTGGAVGATGNATATIRSLSEASQQITGIVQVITKIAGQTRLLALNANIEAARAGDAGRGFLVVANEVKTLADEVSKASESILDQVEDTTRRADEAVDAIRLVTESVSAMDALAGDIEEAVDGPREALPDAVREGLAAMAEVLSTEVTKFLAVLRATS